MSDLDELMELVMDTPDVVYFLRSQMYVNATASAGADWTDTERETADTVTAHRDPRKPPCNLSALDAADLEFATLANWAVTLRVPFTGPVWRSGGRIVGLVGDSTVALWEIVRGVQLLARDGWHGESRMLEDMRRVRNANRKQWGDLDLLLMGDRGKTPESYTEPGLF
ncbi:hypothetical protein [Nocardia terpenica]|uniref:Uncharacterized protein n=1 Tax=Nocardia terpenica TaxID=455432 RepID=A0A6G9Z8D8_9NOCA|nr:hypothetical protein [Nocardia terpenica]QIS21273.1 hypothetical protein F6W96_26050 [Nocardia terpenica]